MALVARFRDDVVAPPPARDAVSDEAFWTQVRASEQGGELDPLYPSAERLVADHRARTAAFDRLAVNLLSWNAGIPMLFLLISGPSGHARAALVTTIIGVGIAIVGVGCAVLALRVPRFPLPTQADGLAVVPAGDDLGLRRWHLLALDTWYSRTSEVHRTQREWTARAGWCAWGVVGALGAAALLRHVL